MRQLILVRHGQHEQETGGLTPLGRRQASATAAALRGFDIDAIHCSTLLRARETAAIIKEALRSAARIRASSLLQERIPTHVAGITRRSDLPELRKNLRLIEQAYRRLAQPSRSERTELVVAHGNLIRLFVCLSLDLKPSTWLKMRIHNASITMLLVNDESGESLASFNEVSHLPLGLRTLV